MSANDILKLLDAYIAIDAPPIRVRDLIADIFLKEKWMSNPADAAAEGEKLEAKVITKVEALMLPNRFGKTARFVMNSVSEDMIQGQAFIEPHDSQSVQDHKRRLGRTDLYVTAFQSIGDGQFERLCAGLLKELGVETPRITPSSRDEGIDFFGHLSLGKFFRPNLIEIPGAEHQFSAWMIGQAKNYGDMQVSTLNIRELVGSAELARSRTFSTRRELRYSDLKVRACDAVYCLFFTTGNISRDAWGLLEASGVIGMDGRMVAQFLAEREVGLLNSVFDNQTFINWVDSSGSLAD